MHVINNDCFCRNFLTFSFHQAAEAMVCKDLTKHVREFIVNKSGTKKFQSITCTMEHNEGHH